MPFAGERNEIFEGDDERTVGGMAGDPELLTWSIGSRGEELSVTRWMEEPIKILFLTSDGNGYQQWRAKCDFMLKEENKWRWSSRDQKPGEYHGHREESK